MIIRRLELRNGLSLRLRTKIAATVYRFIFCWQEREIKLGKWNCVLKYLGEGSVYFFSVFGLKKERGLSEWRNTMNFYFFLETKKSPLKRERRNEEIINTIMNKKITITYYSKINTVTGILIINRTKPNNTIQHWRRIVKNIITNHKSKIY